MDQCRELQAPYAWQLNALIAGAPGCAGPDRRRRRAIPGRNPPNWRLFENLCSSAVDIMLDNETGEAFHPGAADRCGNGPGFLSNRDIAYVFAPTSRGFGELLVLRGRAPTFADTRPGPAVMPSGQQLRYWSFCQYEPATQRVIDCRSDDRVTVGADGRYTIVVSTAANRPAERAAGVRRHVAALGPADAGAPDLPAHAPRPVVRRGDPERPGAGRRAAPRWATTTRAASTCAARRDFKAQGLPARLSADVLDCRR